MIAYFCTATGVRLVAPGVSKTVDPVGGQDEYSEPTAKGDAPEGSGEKTTAPAAPVKTDGEGGADKPPTKKTEQKGDAPEGSGEKTAKGGK